MTNKNNKKEKKFDYFRNYFCQTNKQHEHAHSKKKKHEKRCVSFVCQCLAREILSERIRCIWFTSGKARYKSFPAGPENSQHEWHTWSAVFIQSSAEINIITVSGLYELQKFSMNFDFLVQIFDLTLQKHCSQKFPPYNNGRTNKYES